jgi:hypothetical protein
MRVDELLGQDGAEEGFDPEEFAADRFAGYLLMPKLTVIHGFVKRGWSPEQCTPLEVYTVACWLGVGYSTLVYQMWRSLGLIGDQRAKRLLNCTPKALRTELLGGSDCKQLLTVDRGWSGQKPADIQVGEIVLAPAGTRIEGTCAVRTGDTDAGALFRGKEPGLGRLTEGGGWAVHVRVSGTGYTGRSAYRHLEDRGNV